MAITFDTLKFMQTLEEAGVERRQASAIASAVRDSHDAADVATKGDIAFMRRDVEAMELRLRSDMLAMENRLLIKMGAMLVALFGVAAALKLW